MSSPFGCSRREDDDMYSVRVSLPRVYRLRPETKEVGMRPNREQMLMEVAHVVARRGTCSRLQVGAVVSRNGRILVTGYNGAPAGMPHCKHPDDQEPCHEAVHAEENCIAYAARYGISLEGGEMDTTDSPCYLCSRLIINAGIRKVRYQRLYRVTEGLKLLSAAGVEHWQFAGMFPA